MEWEFDVLNWFYSLHNPVLDKVEVFITWFGNAGIFWIAVSALILIFAKDKRVGATCAVALLSEFIVCNLILKNTVQRDRPCWINTSIEMLIPVPKDYSFPSGHSGASFAVSMSIIQYNRKWGTAAVILASLIALSRLYLYVHFPTDVITGAAIGTLMAFLAGHLVRNHFFEKILKKIKNFS